MLNTYNVLFYNDEVERRRIELEIAELQVDERKERYLQAQKRVEYLDILEGLFNAPRFFRLTSGGRTRFNMLGPNRGGRYLLTAIANVEDTRWRVVTAHWLDERRGKRDYEGTLTDE